MSLSSIIGADYVPQFGAGQDPTRSQQRTSYEQNNPKGPGALEIGDVSKGLQMVDGVTEDFYTDLSNLKSFVGTMYRNYNIDVTKPDLTNPDAVKAHQLYLKASSSIMNRANSLKNSQRMLEGFFADRMSGRAQIAKDVKIGQDLFGNQIDQVYSRNTSELDAINRDFSRGDLTGSNYDESLARYNELQEQLALDIEEAGRNGDLGEAERLALLADSMVKPTKADDRLIKVRQTEAWNTSERNSIANASEARRFAAERMRYVTEGVRNGDHKDPDNRQALFTHYLAAIESLASGYETATKKSDKERYKQGMLLMSPPPELTWNSEELAKIEEIEARTGLNIAKKSSMKSSINGLFEKEEANKIYNQFTGDGWEVDDFGKLTNNFFNGKKIGFGKNDIVKSSVFDPETNQIIVELENGEYVPYENSNWDDLVRDVARHDRSLNEDTIQEVINVMKTNPPQFSEEMTDKISKSSSVSRDFEMSSNMVGAINDQLSGLKSISISKSKRDIDSNHPTISFKSPVKLKDVNGNQVTSKYFRFTKSSSGRSYSVYDGNRELIKFRTDDDGTADSKLQDWITKSGLISKIYNSEDVKLSNINLDSQSDSSYSNSVFLINGKEYNYNDVLEMIQSSGQEFESPEQAISLAIENGMISVK